MTSKVQIRVIIEVQGQTWTDAERAHLEDLICDQILIDQDFMGSMDDVIQGAVEEGKFDVGGIPDVEYTTFSDLEVEEGL